MQAWILTFQEGVEGQWEREKRIEFELLKGQFLHIRKGAYIMRRENVVVERHKIVDQIVLFGA